MIKYIPVSSGWAENRNGFCNNIQSVELMIFDDVNITCVSKKGIILRGLMGIDKAAAIELARAILQELAPEFLMTESEKS